MLNLKFVAGKGVIIIGIGTICLPMVTTSWIGILGNFDLTVCAGVFTALAVLGNLGVGIMDKISDPEKFGPTNESVNIFIDICTLDENERMAQKEGVNGLDGKQKWDECRRIFEQFAKEVSNQDRILLINQAYRELQEPITKYNELIIKIRKMLFWLCAIGEASGIAGLVFAYEQIATLNSALPIMSAATLKTSIFGNILYAATEATVGGSESAIMASIAHSPLMMGLAPEVAFGIWDGIFFPLAGIVIMAIGVGIVANTDRVNPPV